MSAHRQSFVCDVFKLSSWRHSVITFSKVWFVITAIIPELYIQLQKARGNPTKTYHHYYYFRFSPEIIAPLSTYLDLQVP